MAALPNDRHERFAHQIAKGVNAREAYISVGYSPNGADGAASKLQKTAKVHARIAEIKANVATLATEKTGVDKAWVIEQLIEVVEMAKAAEPVRDKDGAAIGEYKQNLAAANKAIELLGKELGMFIDRKEIRTGSLDDVSDSELDRIILNKAKEAGVTLQ